MSLRRWWPAAVAAAVAAAALGAWWAQPYAHVGDAAVLAPAGPAACVPVEPLSSVAVINDFLSTAPGVRAFRGADVGVDVGLGDGRRAWFFGDTITLDDDGHQAIVRNSLLVFSRTCAEMVLPEGGRAVIPDRADGVGYWPMSVFRLPAAGGDTVYVMAQRVRSVGDGAFGFEILGTSVAVFDVRWGQLPVLVGVHDLDPDLADPARPVWGAAAALDGGWVYLYGTSRRRLPGLHGFALMVARVRPAEVLESARWSYWGGSGWVEHAVGARRLIAERRGVSQTLSVFEQEGRWYALSKRDDFLGDSMVVWAAPSPVGPFDQGTTVAPLPCGADGEFTYMPLAHPQLLPRVGTIVVSWSRNSGLDEVCTDPTSYRPQFRRVRLPG
jgi:hypothetical protein